MRGNYNHQIKLFFLTVIFILAVVFLNSANYLKPIKNIFYYFLRYPQNFIAEIGFKTGRFFGFVLEIKNLYRDKIILTSENNLLISQLSALKEVNRENELLRKILNLPLVRKYSLADAEIIGRDPYNPDFVLINRGSESGLKFGAGVIDASGFLFGELVEVNNHNSKVRMITDISSSISSLDQDSRAAGIVRGDLTEGLIFDLVPQDKAVNANDIIISSESENISDLPIARVFSVERYPEKPFLKIKLSPLADLKNTEKVFVIIK